MFYWKVIIKLSCLLICLSSVIFTFYEISVVHEKSTEVNIVDFDQKVKQRISRDGYLRLRRYQLIAKHEINKRYFLTMLRNIGESVKYEGYYCSSNGSDLTGKMVIDNCLTCDEIIPYLHSQHSDISFGGYWSPYNCSGQSVNIIVPYRDRQQHLCVLLRYIIPMLKRQQVEFRIVVAEQAGNGIFNKGKLMNAAFIESTKLFNFHCVLFHDVDLIPENDRNIYICPWQPTHLSVAIDKMHYRLQYDMLVGGVLVMKKDHFQIINGFSNLFWGWGGEDDDMSYRILLSGLRILRPPASIARYKMLGHKKQTPASWTSRYEIQYRCGGSNFNKTRQMQYFGNEKQTPA